MRGRGLLVLVALVVTLVLLSRVKAGIDVTQSLIIAGASAGAVAAIYIIAILATGDKEPDDFELQPGKVALPPAVVWGTRCPLVDGTVCLPAGDRPFDQCILRVVEGLRVSGVDDR